MGTGIFHPKMNRVPLRRASAFAISALAFSASSFAGTLPTGGSFVAGSGTIHTSGSSMTISQTTQRGVIDWSDFSIDAGQRVSFLNGKGATLNRATGGSASLILGALHATGSVYLINPQGIVVGPGGTVATGGSFVASTLDTHDAAFMQGQPLAFEGNAPGSVINLGTIGSSGGDVLLISRTRVLNSGDLNAPRGVAGLAVGANVWLHDSSSGQPIYVQAGSGGSIVNAGGIQAAQVSVQAADGNIFALSGQHTAIRATGTAKRDGHVWLVAGRGNVTLEGDVEAHNGNGSGATVDVNAGTLTLGDAIGDYAIVKAKQWNITTPAMTIDATATPALRQSLNARTSVTLTTTGAQGASGDIDLASTIHWVGAAALTLNAYHSLTIATGAALRNCGNGALTLRADAQGHQNGGSVINHGTLDWSHSLGTVSVLYDRNGTYVPGLQKSNPAWQSSPTGHRGKQIMSYALTHP